MPKEYIEREALLEKIQKTLNATELNVGERVGIRQCNRIIRTQPTADVVEVVRCKECKNYPDFDVYSCKRLPFHFCSKFGNITKEDDYCSYGERK